jgi:hypothetical protein
MKPSKLYEALHTLIGERVPMHIWGACYHPEISSSVSGGFGRNHERSQPEEIRLAHRQERISIGKLCVEV